MLLAILLGTGLARGTNPKMEAKGFVTKYLRFVGTQEGQTVTKTLAVHHGGGHKVDPRLPRPTDLDHDHSTGSLRLYRIGGGELPVESR